MAETANPELSAPTLSADVAAAFDWWRDAGVDCGFTDEPVNWLAPPAEEPRPELKPAAKPADASGSRRREGAAPTPKIDSAALPQDLATFTAWWLAEPLLDDGRLAGRVAPRGASGAAIMVIVPEPEREDQERLLSGPQGRLLDAMLSAMGIAPEQAYVASALPRHTPMADWSAAAARGLGETLLHHVRLVAPRRLIVFGSNALPLLGNDLPNSGQILLRVNHQGESIPLWVATDLAFALARPRMKSRLWQQWLEWTGPDWMG